MKLLKWLVVLMVLIVAAWFAGFLPFVDKYLPFLNANKQQKTVADIRNTGTAMFTWLTDQAALQPDHPAVPRMALHAPEIPSSGWSLDFLFSQARAAPAQSVAMQDYKQVTVAEVEKVLVPKYMASVPKTDAWGHPYEYFMDLKNPLNKQVLAIRSPGRDGKFSSTTYPVGEFTPSSYDEDMVWADGFFVRWPQKN